MGDWMPIRNAVILVPIRLKVSPDLLFFHDRVPLPNPTIIPFQSIRRLPNNEALCIESPIATDVFRHCLEAELSTTS